MAEIKTLENDASVAEFLDKVADHTRLEDAKKLLEIFKEITGQHPKMWGTSIIGFGKYHYKSERSRQEGDWPLTGFSPRKTALTVYIMSGFEENKDLLEKLGKHKKSGGSCLYINKLSDVDEKTLREIIKKSYLKMKRDHGIK